jgi:hypothetical protein
MKTKSMTTLQLRKSIAVMFISAFAVSASFAAPTESPQPTASSAQSSEAQTTRPMKDMPIHLKTQKAEGEASAGAVENPKLQTTRPMKATATTTTLKTQKAEGEAKVHSKRAIAAINGNKNERDAIVAAVKSKNASQIRAIFRQHGIVIAPKPPIVMRQNGYCFYYMCGNEPDGSPRYCRDCVEISQSGYIRD